MAWSSCLSVCVGNDDQEFNAVADVPNGKFLNSSGTFNIHSEHAFMLGTSQHLALLNTLK